MLPRILILVTALLATGCAGLPDRDWRPGEVNSAYGLPPVNIDRADPGL